MGREYGGGKGLQMNSVSRWNHGKNRNWRDEGCGYIRKVHDSIGRLCWLFGWPYAVNKAKYVGTECETSHASLAIRSKVLCVV